MIIDVSCAQPTDFSPGWRRFLADVDVLVVSLDALDLDVLGPMWGTARPERVLEGLGLLHALAGPMRFKLMVNTVIQPGAIEHARAVLDLAGELSITFCPVPVNVGPTVHRELRSDPDYVRLAREILRRKQRGQPIAGSARMLRRLLFSERLRCRNTLKPHVDHDGRLFWPCKASVNVEPIRIDVLERDDVDALFHHATSLRDPTGFHGQDPTQCGADCNWAQNYSTDAYAHGLTHPLALLRDVAGFLG